MEKGSVKCRLVGEPNAPSAVDSTLEMIGPIAFPIGSATGLMASIIGFTIDLPTSTTDETMLPKNPETELSEPLLLGIGLTILFLNPSNGE
jgi:hypothetical protein